MYVLITIDLLFVWRRKDIVSLVIFHYVFGLFHFISYFSFTKLNEKEKVLLKTWFGEGRCKKIFEVWRFYL